MSSTTTKRPSAPGKESRAGLVKRLDLRLAEEEKNEIDQAASLIGSTTSSFVRRTILTAARDTIRLHAALRLTQEGGRQFVAAINNPPEPNEHLRALVREFGRSPRP